MLSGSRCLPGFRPWRLRARRRALPRRLSLLRRTPLLNLGTLLLDRGSILRLGGRALLLDRGPILRLGGRALLFDRGPILRLGRGTLLLDRWAPLLLLLHRRALLRHARLRLRASGLGLGSRLRLRLGVNHARAASPCRHHPGARECSGPWRRRNRRAALNLAGAQLRVGARRLVVLALPRCDGDVSLTGRRFFHRGWPG